MQLVIAEKPSVARDIARVLGVRPAGSHSFTGGEWVITWCVGHLVELEEPAAYDARWKSWRLEALPMLPPRFKLRAAAGTRDQFTAVARLLVDRRFAGVVNACDAGREGELIFRYVYELAGSGLPIRRLWISSMTDEAIRAGFASLKPGTHYDPLAAAARCRSEADWLVGLNATRAVTVRYRQAGGDALYSIGRVQTPTLAILVERERAIRSFTPKDYWEIVGTFTPASGPAFRATWTLLAPPAPRHVRFASESVVRTVLARLAAHAAAEGPGGPVVETLEQKKTREPPPLLFDLTSLQRTANRRFGLSASRTLEVAQALYERHKVLTYPRTDARHLSQDLVGELPKLFAGLAQIPDYTPFARPLHERPPAPPRRVFDDKKVHDHHAIIPTGKAIDLARLDRDEKRLFDLVVRRFLGAFYPDAEFANTEAVIRVGPAAVHAGPVTAASGKARAPSVSSARRNPPPAAPQPVRALGGEDEAEQGFVESLPPPPDRFVARGRVRLLPGWQVVAGFGEPAAGRGHEKEKEKEKEKEEEGNPEATLPVLAEGQRLAGSFASVAKQTKPPPRHTEGTLLAAMETAGRQIEDEELRAAMKEAGLGTPATRASIIETLVKRGFVCREGKQILPTDTGMALVAALPVPSLASPELTGSWEARLSRVARAEEAREAFMHDIAAYVRQVVEAVRRSPVDPAMMSAEAPRRREPALRPTAPTSPRAPTGAPSVPPTSARRLPRPRKVAPKAPAPREASPTEGEAPVPCPRCREGTLVRGHRGWGCSRWKQGCTFVVWFALEGKTLTESQFKDLVTKGKTRKLSWPGPQGQERAGRLVLDVNAPRETGAARFEAAAPGATRS